ncbi:MAG: hypothetical protein ABIC96_01530 [Patescibacteria group bacterium]
MKQKKSQDPLTRKILKSEVKSLEERLEKKFATKFHLQELANKINENAKKYRDQILEKLDETMGELGAMREENTIGSYQTSELRKDVDNHEKRISSLEKSQTVA